MILKMSTIVKIFRSSYFWLFIIFAIFLLIRLPGLDLPFHQDEGKWAGIVNPASNKINGLPHPPLTGLLLGYPAKLLGVDNLRMVPLTFGIFSLLLLYFFVRKRFGIREANWSAFFFVIVFYSVWASLMIDTDGQILPTLFLISLILFYKWQESAPKSLQFIWGTLLLISLMAGILTKMSFVIPIGAFMLEFVCLKWRSINREFIIRYSLWGIGLVIIFVIAIFNAHIVFPNFNLSYSFDYWQRFLVGFSGRNYMQIIIESLKAMLYASPLLILSPLLVSKIRFSQLRILFIFLGLGLFFFLGIFNFGSSALDRYLSLIIVPLSIISGVAVADVFSRNINFPTAKTIVVGCLMAVILFLLQFVNHIVPALYPKIEWFRRVVEFKWNFVMPFTGGSGPLGFYVSWLFIATAWIGSFVLIIMARWKNRLQKQLCVLVVILGLFYNGVFIEEYLFGKINGNAAPLLTRAVKFIGENKEIKNIISYNDIGNYYIGPTGKYYGRLYVAPKWQGSYENILNNYRDYFLVIDIPRLDPNGVYADLLKTCKVIYNDVDKRISAKIYDCKNATKLP